MILEKAFKRGLTKTATAKFVISRSCFLLAFTFLASSVFSQTMEIGLYGGVSYYLGDLNPGKALFAFANQLWHPGEVQH